MRFTRFMLALAGLSIAACSPSPADPVRPDADRIFDADCPKPGPTSGGDTWTEIYNDLIGPKSVGRCQDSACHGGASEQGGLKMLNSQKEAYNGMKDFGIIQPGPSTSDAGADPPDQVAGLIRVLIPLASTGVPKMPRELCGNRYLNDAEINRIKSWGAKGAPE